MKSRLSDDIVEQLAPVLAGVARLVADDRNISPKQLGILLQSVDIAYTDALQSEIEKWAGFLRVLKNAPEEEIEDVKATVRLALLQRGHLESVADLAIATITLQRGKEISSPQGVLTQSLGASIEQIDFGSVLIGETVTKTFDVWGGPGKIIVESDQLQVYPQSFPNEVTQATLSLTPARGPSVFFSSVEVKTKRESFQIGIVALLEDGAIKHPLPDPDISAKQISVGAAASTQHPHTKTQITTSPDSKPPDTRPQGSSGSPSQGISTWVYILAGIILILIIGIPLVLRTDTARETGQVVILVSETPTNKTQLNKTPTARPDPASTKTTATTSNRAARPTTTPKPKPTTTTRPRPTATARSATINNGSSVNLNIGFSVRNKPIEAIRFGNGDRTIVFIGGLHAGFAPATVAVAQRAIDYFSDNPHKIPSNVTLYIITSASPDSPSASGEFSGRLNANGVDLNRNWDCRWTKDAKWRGVVQPGSGGPEPFSEPETRRLAEFLQEAEADGVIFWEARAVNGLVSPGSCGNRPQVSSSLAGTYGLAAGYEVADFEDLTNQELNGDSTNWLDSIGIPAIAVLLPSYTSTDWDNNLQGILAVIDAYGN